MVIIPRRTYWGFGLAAAKIVKQSGGPELLGDGVGLTLFGGLRIGPILALELGWMGTAHNPETVDVGFGPETDTLVLNSFTADAKVFVGGSTPDVNRTNQGRLGPVQPFVQGGLGLYLLDSSVFGTQSVGSGFQLGGGASWSLGRHIEFSLRGLYRGIAMGPPSSELDDTFISSLTFDASAALHF